jgi:hypothetical protein
VAQKIRNQKMGIVIYNYLSIFNTTLFLQRTNEKFRKETVDL